MEDISLYDKYKEKADCYWTSYYDIMIRPEILFTINDSYSLQRCRGFIKRHYTNGQKMSAIDLPFKKEYEKSDRHIHMVSLYLLGLHLECIFADAIKNEFKKNIPGNDNWYDYRYTWFLTCLYHDTSSCIEKITIPLNPTEDQKTLKYYLEELKLNTIPYDVANLQNKAISFRGSDDLAKNYFYYRAKRGSFDHGIIAGYLLYDKLVENFKKKTANHDWKANSEMVDSKTHLHWRLEHIDHFAYIADAIICHNMWTVQAGNKKEADKYKSDGLKDLIIYSDAGKLNMNQYPLQFMLCLLDSIEPVKRFDGQLTSREVLNNVSITFNKDNGGNRIKIAWTDLLKNKSGFYDWQKNIISLKDWMGVDITPCNCSSEECYVTIDIR